MKTNRFRLVQATISGFRKDTCRKCGSKMSRWDDMTRCSINYMYCKICNKFRMIGAIENEDITPRKDT